MQVLLSIAGIVMLVAIPTYLNPIVKFASIVHSEQPEWIDRKGSLSFFYTGMPRTADPNVGLAVLGIAFSSRWRALNFPLAALYVRRIRFLLPLGLVMFGVVLIDIVVSKR